MSLLLCLLSMTQTGGSSQTGDSRASEPAWATAPNESRSGGVLSCRTIRVLFLHGARSLCATAASWRTRDPKEAHV
jgi:hypothetical protein